MAEPGRLALGVVSRRLLSLGNGLGKVELARVMTEQFRHTQRLHDRPIGWKVAVGEVGDLVQRAAELKRQADALAEVYRTAPRSTDKGLSLAEAASLAQ